MPVVIAMPWLRDWLGISRDAAYWFALSLPVALPALYAGIVLFINLRSVSRYWPPISGLATRAALSAPMRWNKSTPAIPLFSPLRARLAR